MPFALLAAIASAGCFSQLPLESGASTLVVTSVLNALQDTQVVVVQRTVNGGPSPSPVDSAMVLITGPDGIAMTGVEMKDAAVGSSYRVVLSASHEQLVPGGVYRLRVALKTGEEVTGTTTIPLAQSVAPPASTESFASTTDTLRLSWPIVKAAAGYEVRVQSSAGVYAVFADTNATLPGTARSLDGKPVFVDGLVHAVSVSAVDAAYHNYYRTSSDEFTGAAVQGNLTGAQGVFGSLVVIGWRSLLVTAGGH